MNDDRFRASIPSVERREPGRCPYTSILALLLSLSILPSTQAALPGQSGKNALPDLVSAPFAIVAGRNVSWNSTTAVPARQTKPAGPNLCEVAIQYNVRNTGRKATGPFQTRFTSSAAPGAVSRQWPSLQPGQSSTQTDILRVRTGANTLTLMIDPANRVRESNETNNRQQLMLRLDGQCGPGRR